MTHLKFNEFKLSTDKPNKKTKRYEVLSANSEEILGIIEWMPTWRQYTLESCPDTVWSSDCLLEASAFIKKLNYKQRNKSKGEKKNE